MEENFWRWAADGTIAVFAATPGWIAYRLHRRRVIARDAVHAVRVAGRLDMIDKKIDEFHQTFLTHAEDDRRLARQIYAMRRDLDRDYVRWDRLDPALKGIVESINRLSDRIDALHQRMNHQ